MTMQLTWMIFHFKQVGKEKEIMRKIKTNPNMYFDYRDVKTLQRYIDVYGRIEPMSKTGLTAKQQRQLAVAIKRARHLALLPFVAER